MQQYISLVKMTDAGRIAFGDSLKRGELAREIRERNGVAMTDWYLTLGQYDVVLFFEADSNRDMAQALVELGRFGAIQTETMVAFGKDIYQEIQAELGAREVPDLTKDEAP
jgi:uncharacterized protein with GYD domain